MTGKSRIKFTYTSYDYSFLYPEPSFWEQIAERVYAKTIGAVLTTVQPMNEPVGQLYWFDTVENRINELSTHISNESSRGSANYMITNNSVANMLAEKKLKVGIVETEKALRKLISI